MIAVLDGDAVFPSGPRMTTTPVFTPRRWALGLFNPPLVGAIVWCSGVLVFLPQPHETTWAKALLLLAVLLLVPLGLRLVAHSAVTDEPNWLWRTAHFLQLPVALFLGWAFLLPQGLLATILALPWFGLTCLLALLGAKRLFLHRRGPVSEVCLAVGLVYVVVGSVWAILDRAAIQPLDFDPVIVLLTAIHFHYAGFALPVLTGLVLRHVDSKASRLAAVGVIMAPPLVAIGITMRQLNFGHLVETIAAWAMAGSGLLTAWLYLCLAWQGQRPRLIRAVWFLVAASLATGMVLAAMYGSRFYLPLAWLDIPWMRAVHGTINALGFGLAGLASWTLLQVCDERLSKVIP
jgi:hypothetical protein